MTAVPAPVDPPPSVRADRHAHAPAIGSGTTRRFHWYDATLAVALVAAAALAATSVGASTGAAPTIRTAAVQRGVVQASVQATGNVAPAGSYAASFSTSGTVTEIDVSAGQWVVKGQTLAKLDATQAGAQLAAATATLSAADANLRQINQVLTPQARNQINVAEQQARAAVDRAAQTLTAAQGQLAADQAANAAATKLTQDQQAVTQAQNQLTQAQDQQQTTLAADAVKRAPPQAGQVDAATASIASAQASLASATKAVSGTVLTAPAAAVVTAINGTVGQSVSGGGSSSVSSSTGSAASSGASGGAGATGASGASGGAGATTGAGGSNTAASSGSSSGSGSSTTGFITLTDMSSMSVNVGFAESDAVNLKAGQPATVSFSALPNLSLPGLVTNVSPISTLVSNVVTYNATVGLTQSDPGVKVGMTASVTVVTSEHDNVLHVPSSAVRGTGTTGTVTVMQGKQQTAVPVGIGLRGDTDVEITSGLREGQSVVTSTSTAGAGATTGNGLTNRLRGTGGLGGGLGGAGGGVGGGLGGGGRGG
jgi:multidrug efflux pump subunit AcrA (membrane-fusion protein)